LAVLRFKRAVAWTMLALLVLATPLRYVAAALVLVAVLFLLCRWLYSLYNW
jgi:hypothetical protein